MSSDPEIGVVGQFHVNSSGLASWIDHTLNVNFKLTHYPIPLAFPTSGCDTARCDITRYDSTRYNPIRYSTPVERHVMTESTLIVFTGDKGGVGKSTLAVLMMEWLLSKGKQVQLVDADPNQTSKI